MERSACDEGRDWSEGVFLVDKPEGLISFAVVRRIRWLLGIKKVGHAGTLDPFATGLLVICAGRAATKPEHIQMVKRMESGKVSQAEVDAFCKEGKLGEYGGTP